MFYPSLVPTRSFIFHAAARFIYSKIFYQINFLPLFLFSISICSIMILFINILSFSIGASIKVHILLFNLH